MPGSAAIVTALQTMVTRRFSAASPVIVTVTQFHVGTAHNVIADEAVLGGTMRTLSASHRAKVHQLLRETAVLTAQAHGLEAEVAITPGFPVTVCDGRAVVLGERVSDELFGGEAWHALADPIMGAEDFSYLLEKVPGAMFFLGVAPEGDNWHQCCGIHSSRMMVDESALPHGTATLAGCALHFLEHGFA